MKSHRYDYWITNEYDLEKKEWDKNHKYSIKIATALFWIVQLVDREWWANIFYPIYAKYSNKYL